ncbi:hypothetical protein A9Q95_03820 [Rhodobacterales bacterium 59_46_T64]|nr:hypothetical protein A9Q95_03820 [Rhodobacterales bacterium 59_46_T64]
MLAMRIVGWAMSSVLQDGTQKQNHQTPMTDTSSAGTGGRGFVPGAAPATGALSPPSAINPATVLANPAAAEKTGSTQDQATQAAADVVRRSANPTSKESAARVAVEAPPVQDHKTRVATAEAMFGAADDEVRAQVIETGLRAAQAPQDAVRQPDARALDEEAAPIAATPREIAVVDTRPAVAPQAPQSDVNNDQMRRQAEIANAESHALSLALQAELRAQYLVREIEAAARSAKQSAIAAARQGEDVGSIDVPTPDQRFAASQVLATYDAAIVASRAA